MVYITYYCLKTKRSKKEFRAINQFLFFCVDKIKKYKSIKATLNDNKHSFIIYTFGVLRSFVWDFFKAPFLNPAIEPKRALRSFPPLGGGGRAAGPLGGGGGGAGGPNDAGGGGGGGGGGAGGPMLDVGAVKK